MRYSARASSALVLEMGVITTKPAKKKELKTHNQFHRLRETNARLYRLGIKYSVDALAFESLSIPRKASKQNAIKIGHPYGSLAMLAEVLDIACVMSTPQAIKKTLCGKINASKDDVQRVVARMWGRQPAVRQFVKKTAASRHNHGWDALAAYVAAGNTDVMKALKRSA